MCSILRLGHYNLPVPKQIIEYDLPSRSFGHDFGNRLVMKAIHEWVIIREFSHYPANAVSMLLIMGPIAIAIVDIAVPSGFDLVIWRTY